MRSDEKKRGRGVYPTWLLFLRKSSRKSILSHKQKAYVLRPSGCPKVTVAIPDNAHNTTRCAAVHFRNILSLSIFHRSHIKLHRAHSVTQEVRQWKSLEKPFAFSIYNTVNTQENIQSEQVSKFRQWWTSASKTQWDLKKKKDEDVCGG